MTHRLTRREAIGSAGAAGFALLGAHAVLRPVGVARASSVARTATCIAASTRTA